MILNVNAGEDKVYRAGTELESATITLYGEYDGKFGTLYTAEEEGEAVTLASLNLTREGHTFAGWFETAIAEDADVSGATEITSSTAYNETDVKTIYAYWTINEYTLKVEYVFAKDNATAHESAERTVKFRATITVESPKLEGYDASVETLNFTMTSEKLATAVEGVVTETVSYSAIEYTLTFNADGGETVEEIKYTIEDSVELPETTYQGYDFGGWLVVKTGEKQDDSTWLDGEEYSNWKANSIYPEDLTNFVIGTGMYGDVEFKAVWNQGTSNFKVILMKENVDGTAYEAETYTVNGTTDTAVTVEAEADGVVVNGRYTYSPEGFTYEDKAEYVMISGEVETETTNNIDKSGNFAVKLYFSRNAYTLNLVYGNSIESVEVDATVDGSMTGSDKEYTVYYGAEITISATEKAGYTWTGFVATGIVLENATSKTISFTMGAGNVSIEATTTIIPYTLTIDVNGGQYASSTEIAGNVETSPFAIADATREGYTFAGWDLSGIGQGTFVEETKMFTFGASNSTIKATWTPNRYKVILNLNDVVAGNGSTTAETSVKTVENVDVAIVAGTIELWAEYDNDYTTLYTTVDETDSVTFADFDANSLTRDGYTFVKWSSTAEGEDEITSSAECKTTETTTIVAIWQVEAFVLTVSKNIAEKVSVSVEGEGVEAVAGETDKYEVTFDTSVTLTATVEAGYHFVNWTMDASVWTTTEVEFDYVTASDRTVVVTIEANGYEVVYNANGGSGAIANTEATYDEDVALSDGTGFVKLGYTISGWVDADDVAYTLGDTVSNLTTEENGVVTLYAVWTANTYNVEFNTNFGSDVETMNATYDVATEIVGTTTRDGYDFLGWSMTNGTTSDAEIVASIGEYATLTEYLVGEAKDAGVYEFEDKYYAFNLSTGDQKAEAEADKATATVYAIWGVGAATYKVEYYLETLAGEFKLDTDAEFETEGLTFERKTRNVNSITGENVAIEQVEFEGFTLDLSVEGTATNGTVASDSSLVLALYYTRNTYDVEVVIDDEKAATTTGAGTYKFNEEVAIEVAMNNGYTYKGMSYVAGEETITIDTLTHEFNVTSDITFTVATEANDFGYVVEFVFETLDGTNYEAIAGVENATLTAKVNTVVTFDMIQASVEAVEAQEETNGFAYENRFVVSSADSVVEPEDGKTKVTVYFARSSYTLALLKTTGVSSITATAKATGTVDGFYVTAGEESADENTVEFVVRYGAEVTITADIADGYEFKDWSTALVVDGTLTMPAENLTQDKAVYANTNTLSVDFKVNFYTANFSANEDEDYSDYTFFKEETYQAPTDSIIEVELLEELGIDTYAIEGFSYETFESGVKVSGSGNTVVKVYFKRNEVEVNFAMVEGLANMTATVSEDDGAYAITQEITENTTISVKFGATINLAYELETIADGTSGYTFNKFTVDGSDIDETAVVVGINTMTISANVSNNKYTITFYGNTGSYEDDENGTITEYVQENVEFNRPVTLADNKFTKTGFGFAGWALTEDGEVEYTDKANFTYSETKSIELYAIWTAYSYNIAYDANGGEGEMESHIAVKFGEEVTLRAIGFTRTGYTFNGWTYENDDEEVVSISLETTKVTSLTSVEFKTVVLKAVWTENSYKIRYNSNYKSIDADNTEDESVEETYLYTANVTIKSNTDEAIGYALTGYKFAGWTIVGTETKLSAGEIVSKLASETDDVVELNANWTAIKYAIVFNGNGGIGEMSRLEATYDTSITLPEATFTCTGYNFDGWTYVDDNGDEQDLADKAEVLNLTTEENKEVVLTAKWKAIEYTITYLANEGEFAGSEETTYVETFTIEDAITIVDGTTLTRRGYTLLGYSFETVEDEAVAGNWRDIFVGDIVLEGLDTTLEAGIYGSVTLKAKWAINTYNLTINYVGTPTPVASYEATLEYGATYSVISPEVEGYSPDIATVEGTIDLEDVEIDVTYTANTYKLTFDLNDTEKSPADDLSQEEYEVVYDAEYGVLPQATRTGYNFLGWTFVQNDTTTIAANDIVKIVENTLVYALWEAKADTAFTVVYKFETLDGSSFVEVVELKDRETSVGVTDTAVTEDMVLAIVGGTYPTFNGYRYDETILAEITADGLAEVVVKYARDYFTLTLTADEAFTTFTATAEETVEEGQVETFYIEDKENGVYSVRYGTTVVLNSTIEDAGYTFVGYTSSNDEITIEDAKLKMTADAVVVTASAEAKSYKIVFNGNDGKTIDDETSYEQTGDVIYKQPLTLDANAFEREGYYFCGWAYEEADADDYKHDFADRATFTLEEYKAEVNLFAVWRPEGYDLGLAGTEGIDLSKATIVVNGEVVETESVITVEYDSIVRVYGIYVDGETTTVVKGGYEFGGFKANDVEVASVVDATGTYYEFTFTESTTITLVATPKSDTSFKVVYALQDLADAEATDNTYTVVKEIVCNEGTTGTIVDYAYLTSLGLDEHFDGFAYESIAVTNKEGTARIEWAADEADYTVVTVRFLRLHFNLDLIAGDGIESISPVLVEGSMIPVSIGYSTDFETKVQINVTPNTGYHFKDFTVVVAMPPEGSTSLGEGTTWTLEGKEDGFYYGEKLVVELVYDENEQVWTLNKMPAYNLTITANGEANPYTITYFRNVTDEDTTTDETSLKYDEEYVIKNITTLGWTKSGYDFAGWATSKANADAFDFTNGYTADLFTGTNDIACGKYDLTEDIVLYAVWTAGDSTYDIEYYFEELDGTFTKDIRSEADIVEKTDKTVEIQLIDVTSEGYVFDEANADNVLTGKVAADGSLVLKAYYKRMWFDLTVSYDDGFESLEIAENANVTNVENGANRITASVKFGTTVTLVKEIKDGYEFVGYTEGTTTNTIITDGVFTMPIAELEIAASTKARTFKITFVGNGGKTEEGDESYEQEFTYLDPVDLKANEFVRAGYTFANWTIEIAGEEETFVNGQLFNAAVASDLTAIANWTPNPHTEFKVNYFTMNINGVYHLAETITLTGETDTTITNAIVMEGFEQVNVEHAGYSFKAIREGEEIKIGGDGLTTVNVDYDLVKFTASVDMMKDGGTEVIDGLQTVNVIYAASTGQKAEILTENADLEIEYSATINIEVVAQAGYKFKAITVKDSEGNADTIITPEDLTEGVATITMPAENIVLAIELETETYTITMNKSFKTDASVETITVRHLESVALTKVFAETGYNLAGWATVAGGEVVYETTHRFESYDLKSDLKLWAVWEAKTYTISFNGGEGVDGQMDSMTATYDTALKLSANEFYKLGFEFAGWNDEAASLTISEVDDAEDITVAGIYFNIADDAYYVFNLATGEEQDSEFTVYAQWTPIKYTIKFVYDADNTVPAVKVDGEFTYGETYKLPALSTLGWTKTGYEFSGWTYFEDADTTTPVSIVCGVDDEPEFKNLTAVADKEVILTAVWGRGVSKFSIKILYETLNGDGNYDETTAGAYTIVSGNDIKAETETEVTSATAYAQYLEGTEYDGVTGFRYNASKQDTITVSGDGNSIVKVYYSRLKYELHINIDEKVESIAVSTKHNSHGLLETSTTETKKYSVKYGDVVELSMTPAEGYKNKTGINDQGQAQVYTNGYFELALNTVSGSEIEVGFDKVTLDMVADFTDAENAIVVNAIAEARDDTPYSIVVYKQKLGTDESLETGYEKAYTLTATGVTNSEIDEAEVLAIIASATTDNLGATVDLTGFAHQTTSMTDSIISPDAQNPTIVSVYYTRTLHDLTINIEKPQAFTTLDDVSRKDAQYGATITLNYVLKAGYTLDVATGIKLVGTSGDLSDTAMTVRTTDNTTFVVTITIPEEDTTLTIVPVERTDIAYTIKYRFQPLTLSGEFEDYEERNGYDDVVKYGTTGAEITRADIGFDAIKEAIDGFKAVDSSIGISTADNYEPTYIAGDGSTVVYIYFNRNLSYLTISLEDSNQGLLYTTDENGEEVRHLNVTLNGEPAAVFAGDKFNVYFEQEVKISIAIKVGYEFVGYKVTGTAGPESYDSEKVGTITYYTYTCTMTGDDLNITATIEPKDVKYTVEFYAQSVDPADNSKTVYNRVMSLDKMGKTNNRLDLETIEAEYVDKITTLEGYNAEFFKGRTYYAAQGVTGADEIEVFYVIDNPANESGDKQEGAHIAGDGSMKIKLYFNLKPVTITFDYDDKHIADVTGAGDYVFGQTVTITATPRKGYKIVSWKIGNDEIAVDEEDATKQVSHSFVIEEEVDIEIVVESTVGTANYTIKHYYESIDGEYVVDETATVVVENVVTESEIEVDEDDRKLKKGYTFQREEKNSTTVLGDGTSVVSFYYSLKTVRISATFTEGISALSIRPITNESSFTIDYNEAIKTYTIITIYGNSLSLSAELEEGYDLSGWFVDNKANIGQGQDYGFIFDMTTVEIDDTNISIEIDLMAMAVAKQFKINYYPENGTSETGFSYAYYGIETQLNENKFKNGKMKFLGWATERGGEVVYLDKALITITSDIIPADGEIDLYAVWGEAEAGGGMMMIIIAAGAGVAVIGLILIIVIVLKKKKGKKSRIMSKQ
ncbi:MAG: InlB B-repeat-containing protein [Clostridia bacterium]|nr:InlB B-repeat-containing protein [Clostridia bacterium]